MNLSQLAKNLDIDEDIKLGEDRVLVVVLPHDDAYRLRIYSSDSIKIVPGEADDYYYAVFSSPYWRWEMVLQPKPFSLINGIVEFGWKRKVALTPDNSLRYLGIRREVLKGNAGYWLEITDEDQFYAVYRRQLQGLEEVLTGLNVGKGDAAHIQSALSRKLVQNVKKA